MSTNNDSIIRLITLFFILLFFLINGLFWIAHQHFSKQHEMDQIRRFMLAERLMHHERHNFGTELQQLMIRPSPLSGKKVLAEGSLLIELPFGKMVEHKDRTFFVGMRPPPPPPRFKQPEWISPPPIPKEGFHPRVLEDIQPHPWNVFWMTVIGIDALVLLFFAYLIRKLLPLHRLKNAIIGFKEGDRSLDCPINGEDEISQITHEFNQALEKIASMREARSLFLRNILHELKTPIMKGSLTADCLEKSPDQERLKRIFGRMEYLLGEFATMEQFSSGEWHVNIQEYRFVDLLDHACDLLLCDKGSIDIRGEESQLIVHADFELFTIALKNLLDNAFKYSDTKPLLTIHQDDITLCSTGEQLPPEKRIFTKPFNRPFENSSVGLGLGLYITDSILRKHGFKLHYRYENGYNCFTLILR